MTDPTCSIDGCGKAARTRGWCVAHYTRWHRYGSPTARVRGEIVDGCRICPDCKVDKPLDQYNVNQAYCKSCAKSRRKSQASKPYDPLFCVECGTPFVPHTRRDVCCGRVCGTKRKLRFDRQDAAVRNREKANASTRAWYAANRDRAFASSDAYRARKKNAFVESVDRLTVYERDNWICQLCDEPIDRVASWPDPSTASIDHRIPLSRGGEHSYANCQTSHLGCNVTKGARMSA